MTKQEADERYTATELQRWKGRWYAAPRLAQRHLGVSQRTLQKYTVSCHWLPKKQGIRTHKLRDGYGRKTRFCDWEDVKLAKKNRDAAPPYPELTGHSPTSDVLDDLMMSRPTLDKYLEIKGTKTKHAPGKAEDGRALPRSYLSNGFKDRCQQERERATYQQKTRGRYYSTPRSMG
jgi:hypothetical protein